MGEGQAFEVYEFDEIAFTVLFDVGVTDVVVLVSLGPIRADERVSKLSFRIRYQNNSFPETDQWRQARARAWVSGTN